MAEPDDEIPWYRQPQGPEPYLTQAEELPQAPQGGMIGGRSADEVTLQNYLSPPREDSSLLGTLGGGAQAPAGGSALMLPLLMAQMQQSPLNAFSNAYAAADARLYGRPAPTPTGPSQYQQFQMIHEVMKDQALDKERTARLTLAQQNMQRLKDDALDKKTAADKKAILSEGDAQMALAMRSMGDDRPEVRTFSADNFLAGAEKRGYVVNNPDELKAAITRGDLSPKRLDEVLKNLNRGVPKDVVAGWPGMSPGLVDTLTAPNGPVALMMKDTEVARKKAAAEANIEEAKLIEHKYPEFYKATPEVIGAVQAVARNRFGTTYDQLPDDTSRALAFDEGFQNTKTAKMAEYKQQQQLQYDKAAQLARLHAGLQIDVAKAEGRGLFAPAYMDKGNVWVDRVTGMPVQGDEGLLPGTELLKRGKIPLNQKQVDQADAEQRAWMELKNMKWTADQMTERKLFSGQGAWPRGGVLGAVTAPVENFYKSTVAPQVAPTDSDRALLKGFEASKTALINIDRQLGTLGVRAFGAYGPQLSLLSPATGKEGVALGLSQVEDALRAQGGVQKLPGVYVPQDRIWTRPTLGKGTPAPPAFATAAPNLELPPVSRATVETFRARAMAKYPPEEAMQKINEFLQMNRIVD